jgi:hypothetical protein
MTWSTYTSPPIAFERIHAMITALRSDGELSTPIRAEIADALDILSAHASIPKAAAVTRLGDKKHIAYDTWTFALVAKALIDKYDAKPTAAVAASIADADDPDDKLSGAVMQHLKALRKGKTIPGQFPGLQPHADLVARAAKRLDEGNNQK